jgi:hypothetical protein
MNDSGIKGKEYELTDLWHALKVERRLLLLAQENYRSLKTKFTQLTVDYEHLKETVSVKELKESSTECIKK